MHISNGKITICEKFHKDSLSSFPKKHIFAKKKSWLKFRLSYVSATVQSYWIFQFSLLLGYSYYNGANNIHDMID